MSLQDQPNDILQEIIYYLYPVEIFTFRAICKRFASIGSEYFWKRKSLLDFDDPGSTGPLINPHSEGSGWKNYLRAYKKALESAGLKIIRPTENERYWRFIDSCSFIEFHPGNDLDSDRLWICGFTTIRCITLNESNIYTIDHDCTIDSVAPVTFGNMFCTYEDAVAALDKKLRPVKSLVLRPSEKLRRIAFKQRNITPPSPRPNYLNVTQGSSAYLTVNTQPLPFFQRLTVYESKTYRLDGMSRIYWN